MCNNSLVPVILRQKGSELYEKLQKRHRIFIVEDDGIATANNPCKKRDKINLCITTDTKEKPIPFGIEFQSVNTSNVSLKKGLTRLPYKKHEKIRALSVAEKGDGRNKQVFYFTPTKIGKYILEFDKSVDFVDIDDSRNNTRYSKSYPVKIFINKRNKGVLRLLPNNSL